MTQTPEEEPRHLRLKAESRQTEMGFEVRVHSLAVNLTVEVDLDYDPEYVLALLSIMPQIMDEQMQTTSEESDEH